MTIGAELGTLAGLRATVAGLLDDAPVEVHTSIVDAVSGPCLIVGWGEPWLDPQNICAYVVRPTVLCVAGRIEPGPGVERLEELVAFVLDAVRPGPFAIERVDPPAITSFGNVEYLSARVVLLTAVTMKGGG